VTVIADTSPLQYAVEIDVAHTLFMIYGRSTGIHRLETPHPPDRVSLEPGAG
jgi:hypothetical protein